MYSDGEPPIVAMSEPDPRCGFDPNAGIGSESTTYQDAGLGSAAALRTLLDASMKAALAIPEDEPYAIVAAAEALGIARLCAAHRMSADVRVLAGALCLTSERARRIGFDWAADTLMGESVSILERLADEGDDIAVIASGRLVELHPVTVGIAQSILSRTEK